MNLCFRKIILEFEKIKQRISKLFLDFSEINLDFRKLKQRVSKTELFIDSELFGDC